MTRELTNGERVVAWHLCGLRHGALLQEPACPTCRADIVRLVDGSPREDETQTVNRMILEIEAYARSEASKEPHAMSTLQFALRLALRVGREQAVAEAVSVPPEAASEGVRDVLAERKRQREKEGWSVAHDDCHTEGELAQAAACYAWCPPRPLEVKKAWPWGREWWKPTPTDRRRELVKAGALIIAEIERLDRAAASTSPETTDGR